MGFRYRKTINLGGGFKINLSKSGIGYSWGTKGYRVTRTARGNTRRTFSIPGTGFSYSKESRGGSRRRQQARTAPQNRTASKRNEYNDEHAIKSANISSFKDVEEGTVSDALERTIKLDFLGTILLLSVALVVVHPVLVVLPLVGTILKVAAHTLGKVKLEYSFDPEKQDEYTRKIDAWGLLAEGKKEWQILTEQLNSNRKVHAGADRNIKRVECKIRKGHPFYINTNVDTIQIDLANKEKLIILPDKVFFVRKRRIGAINYNDFRISVSSVVFAEREAIPKDATVVGQTWQYVNKNGTPDQRYRNNKLIPLCQYGRVFLRSDSGLNVELQISNLQNTRDFGDLII